ncbi:MAG: cell envelope integrity protein TolA [Bdellovibrionota bacterium]
MTVLDDNFSDQSNELKLVLTFIFVSSICHLIVLLIDPSILFKKNIEDREEITISADILPDIDLGAATQDALPNAKQAEELKVDKQILPQMPKKFTIEEKTPEKSEMAIEAIKKEKEADKEKEAGKDKELQVVKKKEQEALEVRKKDALARLLKEHARKEKKFAKETEAPLSEKLAQRKMELENKTLGVSGGGAISKHRLHKYLAKLERAIKRNYSLPQVYNLANAKLETRIRMVLNDSGNLQKLEIAESSGEASFDQLALKAVQNSVPLPKPPSELAGESFVFVFTPNTM